MITIEEMETSYGRGKTFRAEKVCFDRGEITSVIGKNGCGKTTLLRTITGVLPYHGSIRIDGEEIRDLKGYERARKIAYLPQMMKAGKMNVETLVEHGRYPWHGNFRRMSAQDKEVMEAALEITHMSAMRNRDLTQLSGGELRRAYLAMVIAQNADMILLDEPTTYMDVESQELFLEIVRSLAAGGHGIVMTCHNMEQSFSVSNKIVMMDNGSVKKTGTPEELACDRDNLVKLFGAAVKRVDDENLVYPYVMVR